METSEGDEKNFIAHYVDLTVGAPNHRDLFMTASLPRSKTNSQRKIYSFINQKLSFCLPRFIPII